MRRRCGYRLRCGFAGKAHEAFGRRQLLVLVTETLELQAECAPRRGSQSTADRSAERATGQRAERAAGERQRRLDHALEAVPDCLPERRTHDRADRARDLAHEVAEKPIKFVLVADGEQFGRKFELARLVECSSCSFGPDHSDASPSNVSHSGLYSVSGLGIQIPGTRRSAQRGAFRPASLGKTCLTGVTPYDCRPIGSVLVIQVSRDIAISPPKRRSEVAGGDRRGCNTWGTSHAFVRTRSIDEQRRSMHPPRAQFGSERVNDRRPR